MLIGRPVDPAHAVAIQVTKLTLVLFVEVEGIVDAVTQQRDRNRLVGAPGCKRVAQVIAHALG
jgi:rRNA processing protein Krr1/Pno1